MHSRHAHCLRMSQDDVTVHAGLVHAVSKRLGCPSSSQLPSSSLTLVRKSFDARRGKKWVYVVDVAAAAAVAAGAKGLFERQGLMERWVNDSVY